MARLKNRVPKITTQSQFKAEEENEEGYDPKKRDIGMDYLEFVKKKPSHKAHKQFSSAYKTTSDWGLSIQNDIQIENKRKDCDDLTHVIYDVYSKEEKKSMTPSHGNIEEQSDNKESMKPIYDTREFKVSKQKLNAKLIHKSKLKSKRKSRSKNRRNGSEERKETKNSSIESNKLLKSNLNPKNKQVLTRPFSGGYKKSIKENKVILKTK